MLNWNIRNWLKQLIPPSLRGATVEAWLYSLLKPIETLYGNLVTFRLSILDKMQYNGQTIVLETLLNNLFDNIDRRIRIITESDALPDNFIYRKVDALPLYIYTKAEAVPVYLYTGVEYIAGYEFIVKVAAGSLSETEIIRLKATVNYYRIAGKRPLFKYDDGTLF